MILPTVLSLVFLSSSCHGKVLFNFTGSDNTDSFYEVSDTVRDVGMSKAQISIVQSESVRRAVMFTLLNPQSNSACFAGVETGYENTSWSDFDSIALEVRAQGMYMNFKVIIQDFQSTTNSSLAFEHFFVLPEGEDGTFDIVKLNLDEFHCSYRGQSCEQILKLDQIISLGLQAAGGVYEDNIRNRGVASLEINYIELLE